MHALHNDLAVRSIIATRFLIRECQLLKLSCQKQHNTGQTKQVKAFNKKLDQNQSSCF
jgi:hypothetical protein